MLRLPPRDREPQQSSALPQVLLWACQVARHAALCRRLQLRLSLPSQVSSLKLSEVARRPSHPPSMADEDSIQRELLAQLDELNRSCRRLHDAAWRATLQARSKTCGSAQLCCVTPECKRDPPRRLNAHAMLSTLKMLQGAAEAARVRSMQDRRLLFQGTVHSALIGKVYLDWPVVGWGFVLFWVSFMRCPLVRTILSLLHPTTC